MAVRNKYPKEAIILAGGMGTRLKNVVKDIPKPMAPVNGKPFLYHLLKYLRGQGINHFVLSVGYQHEVIKAHFEDDFEGAKISYAVEKEPLGTGGGIRMAAECIGGKHFWVINGDTYLDVNLSDFYGEINSKKISLALKEMKAFDRYGTVETDDDKIIKFQEKKYTDVGLINAGVYCIEKDYIKNLFDAGEKFSFEKDVLEKNVDNTDMGYHVTKGDFIDIGIPEDYFDAQFMFFNNLSVRNLFELDKDWTIFLDRDGVINKRLPGKYVKTINDFEFLPGAKQAIKKLGKHFQRIVVVTNQQGLAKGYMTEEELKVVNDYMITEINKSGGRIDGVYYCADSSKKEPNCRKPNPDLAQRAKKDFPEIDFQKSIMFGDSISDMEFGNRLGMKTILISTKEEEINKYPLIPVDLRIRALKELIF